MCADEILEVMKTSRQRWTTLRGSGRDWRHNVRRREAFMRDVSSDTKTLTVFSEGFEPPDRSEQEESFWASGSHYLTRSEPSSRWGPAR